MGLLIVICLIVFTFVNPSMGSIVFIIVAGLVEGYCGFMIYNNPKLEIDNKYNSEEKAVIKRYHVFFMYPGASRMLSAFLSAIQLSAFILTPYLVWKGYWVQGIIIGLNYFLASQFSVPLNPQHFLHESLDKGKIKNPIFEEKARTEMKAIDSALEKMYTS